jgi:hypothetical protein
MKWVEKRSNNGRKTRRVAGNGIAHPALLTSFAVAAGLVSLNAGYDLPPLFARIREPGHSPFEVEDHIRRDNLPNAWKSPAVSHGGSLIFGYQQIPEKSCISRE